MNRGINFTLSDISILKPFYMAKREIPDQLCLGKAAADLGLHYLQWRIEATKALKRLAKFKKYLR